MKNVNNSMHDQFLLFVIHNNLFNESFIVCYNSNDREKFEYTFEILEPNKRFVFNQKNLISLAIQKELNKIILLYFQEDINKVMSLEIDTIKKFKKRLGEFDINLICYYAINFVGLREIDLT